MATETATVKMRDGTTAEMEAEVTRYSAGSRGPISLGIFLTSVVVGLATIVVPGVHFVAPWLLPLMGGAVAWYLYNRVATVQSAKGTCPSCHEDVHITEGGALGNDPLWLRCPSCNTPLEFLDSEAS